MVKQHIFTLGGPVDANSGSTYLRRDADDTLFDICVRGDYAHVLAARQMGKTSLMNNTCLRLLEAGIHPVVIDLQSYSVDSTGLDLPRKKEQWYRWLIKQIVEGTALDLNIIKWWNEHAVFGATEALRDLFEQEVFPSSAHKYVVFIDEIDTTLLLPFADDFFAAIRAFYHRRAMHPEWARLSFVLLGVATPDELIKDLKRTPFNIGHAVELRNFGLAQLQPLASGFDMTPEQSVEALTWVYKWTNGHPNLTQKLCSRIASKSYATCTEQDIDDLVKGMFFDTKDDSNLQFVSDMLTKRFADTDELLAIYREIRLGQLVPDETTSPLKNYLKLSGIVRRENGNLVCSNQIYERVFDLEWVDTNISSFDRRVIHDWNLDDLEDGRVKQFLGLQRAKRILSGQLNPSKQTHLGLLKMASGDRPLVGTLMCFAPQNIILESYPSCSVTLKTQTPDGLPSNPISLQHNLLTLGRIGLEAIRAAVEECRDPDTLPVPDDVLYAAYMNALLHRDYSKPTPIEVLVTPQYITMHNPGPLLEGVALHEINYSPDTLRRVWRNPLITEIFLVDQAWHETRMPGIARMMEAALEAGLPRPVLIETERQELKVIIFRKKPAIMLLYTNDCSPELLETLHLDLQSGGIAVWADSFNRSRATRSLDAYTEILPTIETILLLISADTLAQEDMRRSLEDSLFRYQQIVPLVLEEVELPAFIRDLDPIQIDRNYPEGLEKLKNRLANRQNNRRRYLLQVLAILETYFHAESSATAPLRATLEKLERQEGVEVVPVSSKNVYVSVEEIQRLATEESGRLHHYYIGVEHLFLALTKIKNGLIVSVLEALGLEPHFIRYAIEQEIGTLEERRFWPGYRFTPRAEGILELATEKAGNQSPHEQHLLLAILEEARSIPIRVLQEMDINIGELRATTANWVPRALGEADRVPIEIQGQIREFSEAEMAVLQRMFRSYQSLVVHRELNAGLTSDRLLVVEPRRFDRADPVVVVRISGRDSILAERRNYETYVRDSFPATTARVLDNPTLPENIPLAGLKYSLIQSASETGLLTLQEYATVLDPQSLGTLIQGIWDAYSKSLWAQHQRYRFAVWREYEHALPPALELTLIPTLSQSSAIKLQPLAIWSRNEEIEIGQEVELERFTVLSIHSESNWAMLSAGSGREAVNRASKVLVTGFTEQIKTFRLGEIVPSLKGKVVRRRKEILLDLAKELDLPFDLNEEFFPLNNIEKLPNPLLQVNTLLEYYISGRLSIIHGDFRLDNILVSPNRNDVRLIDFASVREGYNLYDWSTLELSILTTVVAPHLEDKGWAGVIEALQLLQNINLHGSLQMDNSVLAKSFQPLIQLREVVNANLTNIGDWREYFIGLTLLAIGELSRTPAISTQARQLLFGVAALSTIMAKKSESLEADFSAATDMPFEDE